MEDKKDKKIFGLPRNVISLGFVSFLNDVSSEMVFPFIPIFLTSVLGASASFVGLVEGSADATSSIVKIFAGRISDKLNRRKPFVVFGYSFSALAKPLLALAVFPWHVFTVRFLDRVGKGMREAPRDALISSSVGNKELGRAFGFNRGADRLGAVVGPFIAFLILPIISNNYRTLFFLSFIASFFAVLILIFTVKEPKKEESLKEKEEFKFEFKNLGTPFKIFIISATIFAMSGAPEIFIILRASEVGVPLVLIPIIYLVYNLVYSVFSVPAGIVADKIGHRNTFMMGMLVFSGTFILFANVTSPILIWFVFAIFGLYSALTDGVGRAIVADLVEEEKMRATAYGIYNACTGLAILPGSLIFGYFWDVSGSETAFYYGSALAFVSFVIFAFLRAKKINRYGKNF